jgi:hypothetical protein
MIVKRVIIILALVGLLISLWPNASSLYDLTGEESLLAQLRGVVQWLNTAVRPQPSLAPHNVTDYADLPVMGINTFLEQEAEVAKRERSLQLIREAGFTFIRQEFPWEDIEIHGRGDFEDRRNVEAIGIVSSWDKYDNIVDLAEQNGIEIMVRLSNPPSWSRSLPDEEIGSQAPPDDITDFSDFAATVAGRYAGRITYFQVWNEPNIYPEWGEQDVNPEAYTALLCDAYGRIKQANPEAVVVAGAMSPTVAMNGRNMNDLIFLQRMYNAGAGDCFDILSAQGYGLFSGATDQRLRPTVINYPHHMLLRDVMVQNGDAHKSIWISEMGWNVVPDGLPQNFGQVTEEQQARYAVEAYERARSEWPWLGMVNYWFFKRKDQSELNEPFYYFRAMEPDFTPLPVWEALAEYGNSEPSVEAVADWVWVWGRIRPLLFTISSAILFFSLLAYLSPNEEEK